MNATLKTTFFDTVSGEASFASSDLTVIDESTLKRVKESQVVGIYPDFTYQTFEGYGCAMTETSCYLLSKMEPETRKEVLKTWFGPTGMNAKFIRMHIDSCDYSLSEYQAVEDPIADPELETFSLKRDQQYILPVMKEALELCDGQLSVLLSPWSPPYQWKTCPEIAENDQKVYGDMGYHVDFSKPGRCFGGRLKPEFYPSWAKYLVKYIKAYLAEGIPVTMLSVQNEANAATNWDSCVWSGEQEKTFLRDFLYPAMKEAGLTEKIGIYIWDHNKERMIEHIMDMMTPDTMDLVQGFAYHWYTGDHFDALSMIHEKYPDKILMHSESCGLHIPGKVVAWDIPGKLGTTGPKKTPLEVDFMDAVNYAHDIIGDINHGMQRWMDWNLIVDRTGGPRHVQGGFCAPLVAEDDGSWSKTISFEYLTEIASCIRPGAVRLGSSVWGKDVEACAVRNTDGNIGVLLLNDSGKDITVTVRLCGCVIDALLPAHTLNTLMLTQLG